MIQKGTINGQRIHALAIHVRDLVAPMSAYSACSFAGDADTVRRLGMALTGESATQAAGDMRLRICLTGRDAVDLQALVTPAVMVLLSATDTINFESDIFLQNRRSCVLAGVTGLAGDCLLSFLFLNRTQPGRTLLVPAIGRDFYVERGEYHL